MHRDIGTDIILNYHGVCYYTKLLKFEIVATDIKYIGVYQTIEQQSTDKRSICEAFS